MLSLVSKETIVPFCVNLKKSFVKIKQQKNLNKWTKLIEDAQKGKISFCNSYNNNLENSGNNLPKINVEDKRSSMGSGEQYLEHLLDKQKGLIKESINPPSKRPKKAKIVESNNKSMQSSVMSDGKNFRSTDSMPKVIHFSDALKVKDGFNSQSFENTYMEFHNHNIQDLTGNIFSNTYKSDGEEIKTKNIKKIKIKKGKADRKESNQDKLKEKKLFQEFLNEKLIDNTYFHSIDDLPYSPIAENSMNNFNYVNNSNREKILRKLMNKNSKSDPLINLEGINKQQENEMMNPQSKSNEFLFEVNNNNNNYWNNNNIPQNYNPDFIQSQNYHPQNYPPQNYIPQLNNYNQFSSAPIYNNVNNINMTNNYSNYHQNNEMMNTNFTMQNIYCPENNFNNNQNFNPQFQANPNFYNQVPYNYNSNQTEMMPNYNILNIQENTNINPNIMNHYMQQQQQQQQYHGFQMDNQMQNYNPQYYSQFPPHQNN